MIVARKILGQMGRYRAYVRVVLLVVYLVIPWLNWGDRPLILLDIASRRFYFPGAVFWPQESYFLLLILMAMGLALFLFTSLFGRLWCGWACPQTVYTELFDNIGRLVSPRIGKASQKLWEKVLVQLVWFITSLLLTYHFIAYFVGARVMLAELIEFGPGVFSEFTWPFFWVGIAAIFHFDLGIFRHNFCVYVCPYARFQSVMLDRDSVVVAYDSHRGEPRRGKKVAAGSKEEAMVGDCTSCTKCVQVCPTGIDIRQGLQVACINCAHCIDACVEEMARYDKETLVGYSSLRFFEERKKSRFLRPRTFIYATLISVVIGSFGVLLAQRQPAALSVNRDPQINPMIAGDLVRNVYRVDLANMREKDATYGLNVEVLESPADFSLESLSDVLGESRIHVAANEKKTVRIMLEGQLAEHVEAAEQPRYLKIRFHLLDEDGRVNLEKDAVFTIPAHEAL